MQFLGYQALCELDPPRGLRHEQPHRADLSDQYGWHTYRVGYMDTALEDQIVRDREQ
jgi:hypothetical protein